MRHIRDRVVKIEHFPTTRVREYRIAHLFLLRRDDSFATIERNSAIVSTAAAKAFDHRSTHPALVELRLQIQILDLDRWCLRIQLLESRLEDVLILL